MAVIITTPLSLWMQLASFCFTLGGLVADLLVIRVCLLCAYVCLLMNTVLGGPLWPHVIGDTSNLRLDALLWAVLNIWLHGSSLVLLLTDEAKVRCLTDDQAALWRLFYRTGGMSERIFHEVMIVNGRMQVVEYDAGTSLQTEDDFYILYEGSVTMYILDPCGDTIQRPVGRGEIFDFKHLGMLSKSRYFQETYIRCETQTKAKLFRFRKDDMLRVAHHPLSKVVWQSLLINNLSRVLANARRSGNINKTATTPQECAMDDTPDNDDDIFAPLEDWELPDSTMAGSGSTLRRPLQHIWLSLRRSFHYPWPCGRSIPGMRQTQLAAPNLVRPLTPTSDDDENTKALPA